MIRKDAAALIADVIEIGVEHHFGAENHIVPRDVDFAQRLVIEKALQGRAIQRRMR